MLSWKESDLPQIMKTIITDPDHFLSEGNCIEGHILFMSLRYADHCSSDTMTTQLIESTVSSLQYLTKHYKDNLNLLCHWLGNITCLLQSMRQYSGDPVYYNPCKDVTGLTSFELSDYHDFITAEAMSIYYLIINHLERTLEPLIVPGLLEHESILCLTSARPVGWGRTLLGIVKPVIVTVSDIERFLNDLLNQLEFCLVDTYLIEQMFKQIFYFINGVMLNYLLFRKDLCHWTSGMQIRYNLNVLEEWLREHKLTCVVDTLQPIVQASKLLQMKKETQDDARCISEFCANLNTQQIQKILRMYTPSIESESRVPLSVIQFVGQCHRQDHRFGSETENLMIDSRYQFPVSIPYSPTLFNFAAIDVPKQLDFLIKI
ncbi:PREDICTED: unconventional myosin-Vb-like [Amphimedon queenslandica]|uniref:Dilute domain-containing protein n=1 Tax=Amphimedon queenslandica TaxID=400682 RepID=A0AAN0IJ61_AMPQE|nr:PREDICTED: unconventional myosin-Vb-like [Amphimedon queenslandica]|eukprot:XP_003391776.2 PREDICTED: unconventional myosin-Vb-like [Amphimedon queenslandica]